MSVKSDFHDTLGDLINTVGHEIAEQKGTVPLTEINELLSRLGWGEYERTPSPGKDLESAFKDFLDKLQALCTHYQSIVDVLKDLCSLQMEAASENQADASCIERG